MTRNLFYLLALIIAGGLAYYLIKYRSGGTLDINEKDFAVTDTNAIGKIFIADMQGNKIELTRTGSQWLMNGKYPARRDAVETMLTTLRNMSVRYPVPASARENVIKEMSGNNKKVILFDRNNNEIKTIYIGHPPLDNVGNYMLIEGAKMPYAVEIPYFHGSLDTRFVTDTADMRSRTIIAVPFTSLASLSVIYNDRPDSSFTLDFTKSDSFKVYNPVTKSSLMRKEIDKDKLFAYANLLKEVNCEAYENSNPTKSSVLQQRPFCTLTFLQRDGKQHIVECYYKAVDQRSKTQTDEAGIPISYDVDRFYGLVDGRDFVLLQYFHFGRLLQNTQYFKL